MPKLLIASFFVLFFFGLTSCSSTKNVAGTYRNNFAVLNFFGTTIRLMQDSSLQYVFQGDLMYDSITGCYTIYGDKLYLNFDKERQDTNKLYSRFDIMPIKTVVHLGDTLKYKMSLVIGHKKLFLINSTTGTKVTKAKKYHKRKKFIFFGSHYYNKRYYLRKLK